MAVFIINFWFSINIQYFQPFILPCRILPLNTQEALVPSLQPPVLLRSECPVLSCVPHWIPFLYTFLPPIMALVFIHSGLQLTKIEGFLSDISLFVLYKYCLSNAFPHTWTVLKLFSIKLKQLSTPDFSFCAFFFFTVKDIMHVFRPASGFTSKTMFDSAL